MVWVWVVLASLLVWALLRRRRRRPAPASGPRSATLRDVEDADGTRSLYVVSTPDGGLSFEGLDRGDGVERAFGEREYEWVLTVPPAAARRLHAVLGSEGNVIAAVQKRFGGARSSELMPFLNSNGIRYEFWSRLGD